jgi:hypothetical protein
MILIPRGDSDSRRKRVGQHEGQGVCRSASSRPSRSIACCRVVEFATDLPPNSPKRRDDPASATGSRLAVLGFPKRRGGDSNPRYRSPGPHDRGDSDSTLAAATPCASVLELGMNASRRRSRAKVARIEHLGQIISSVGCSIIRSTTDICWRDVTTGLPPQLASERLAI